MDRNERSEAKAALRWVWWAAGITCWSLFFHFGITSIDAWDKPLLGLMFPKWMDIAWAVGMYVSGAVGLAVSILALSHVVRSTVVRRRGLVLALLIGCMLENLVAVGSVVVILLIGIFGV